MSLFSRLIPRPPTTAGNQDMPVPDSDREATALIDEGNALDDQGRNAEALDRYDAAIRVAPQMARAYMNRGNALLALDRVADALAAYGKAVALKPDYGPAHYNLGNAYWRSGQREAALTAYRSALAAAPALADAEMASAAVLAELGRGEDAVASYRRTVQARPDFVHAHRGLGAALAGLRQFDAAAASFRQACALDPADAESPVHLGTCLVNLGRLDEAAAAFRQAIAIEGSVAAHYNLAVVLHQTGRAQEAIASYRSALAINPNLADAHANLGNVLLEQGQAEDAIASYRRALQIAPDNALAHHNLGNALHGLGRAEAAIASYRSALECNPGFAEAHLGLGNAQKDCGRMSDAAASYRRAAECKPDLAEAHFNLGNALRDLGHLDEATTSYRRALAVKPTLSGAHHNLGHVQMDTGNVEDAVASYRRAVEIEPTLAEAWTSLGNAHARLGQFDQAIRCHARALAVDPKLAEAHGNLGNTFYQLGRLDESIASYHKALQLDPSLAQAYTGLFFSLCHDEATTAETLFAEHCRFGAQYDIPLAQRPAHANVRDPDRPLKIGFVSADLRTHAVARFFEPVLEHLAGNRALTLYAYYNYAVDDAVTDRLRRHFHQWLRSRALSDEALCDRIRQDGIDILVDLSGHTSGNRLPMFARKPAPVQASWLGYPGTTGLRAMDYYLSTRHFLPPEQFASQFTEALVSLPESAPFLPDEAAPPVNSLPALANGFVTFGSFNRLSKLRPAAIALWSRLLRALPDSRIVLAGMPPLGQYEALAETFAAEGIARDRLAFEPRCATPAYLALHHKVDICLDTFPYTGGTTTVHALWMGVPTLTLAGSTPASRQGASFSRIGLERFIAHDPAEFEQLSLWWAQHLDALSELRAGLRERCKASLMQRPDVIAAGLDIALRTMWRRYCAGLAPEAFEVTLSG